MYVRRQTLLHWPFTPNSTEVTPDQFQLLLEEEEKTTPFKMLDVRERHERDIMDLELDAEIRLDYRYEDLTTGLYDQELPRDVWLICFC